MDSIKMMEYLKDLGQNNNREWHHSHKGEYQEAKEIFEQIVSRLSYLLGELDGIIIYQQPKELIYRLRRDIRFSTDKTPYNPSFRAHISPYGKSMLPLGYYVSIMPDNQTFLGVGTHTSGMKEITSRVRDYIAEHGDEFEYIVTGAQFSKHFTLLGDKLTRMPYGYEESHPQAKYLKNKSWYVSAF